MIEQEVSPYKTKIDSGNAYWMARLASLAYRCKSESDPFPNEEEILENLRKDDIEFLTVKGFNINSAQAVIIEHNNYICFAFRGTDELVDWLDNADIRSEKQLFGKFHKGFWNSTLDLWDSMWKHYKKLLSQKKRPLFLTGHSLGGALATIATAKLVYDDLPFTSVYTFGQPRAVDRTACRILNTEAKERYFRFQNNNDIVTRVPPRLAGFSHVGTYLYISEEKTIHTDPGFWFKFLDAVDGVVSDLANFGIDGIKDHNMDLYLKAVQKWKFKG
ncbi:MAG: lipase [Candidatus Cloacimonadota bacterium]|nr:MAG: lipase [Candidatus Cloacimonadota bacterium]